MTSPVPLSMVTSMPVARRVSTTWDLSFSAMPGYSAVRDGSDSSAQARNPTTSIPTIMIAGMARWMAGCRIMTATFDSAPLAVAASERF